MKKSILFVAQLPPPIHGAALRNQSLLESKRIAEQFLIHPLPLNFVKNLQEIGKFSLLKMWLTLSFSARLIYILAFKRIDLIYFTMTPSGGAFYRDCIFLFIMKLFRKPRILHFRKMGIRKTAGKKLGLALVKFVLRDSYVIALSNNQASEIMPYSNMKPFIVPNGIKVDCDDLFAGIQPAHNPVRILFLSNLMATKGLKDLIDAVAILHKKDIHFELSVVGAEVDVSYAELQSFIDASELSEVVRVVGPKYGRQKFSELVNSDIFVFPTYFELFPGVVLEAMQFGKAIVTTFEGSIPEIIDDGKNGLLVPQRDPVALAKAIESLITDTALRQSLGENARDKFFSEFTLERFELNVAQVFDKVSREN